MRLKILLVITALLALAAVMAINANTNPQDVANGWYPNLPKVTAEMLQKRVACLVDAGLPASPALVTDATLHIPGDNPFAPAELVWRLNGREVRTTAVLTYYFPGVAYVEAAKDLGLPLKSVSCPDQTVLVSLPVNPIGKARPDRCATCFDSIGAEDHFEVGARFTDGSGTYTKQRGWWAFVPYSYWVRQ